MEEGSFELKPRKNDPLESPEFFVVLFFHISFLVLGFGSVLVTDLYGLLWLWDRIRFQQIVSVSGITEKFIWVGWTGMVAAGIPLILMKGEVDNLMLIKLAFVALIGLNGISLHLVQKKLREFKEEDTVPGLFMFRMMLTTSVSQIGWWGAVLIGFLHRHVQTIIEWPDQPWLLIGIIIGIFLLIWGMGELYFRNKKEETVVET